jgi:hypothetical protein
MVIGIPEKELKAIGVLNKHGVEYLLIGGYAMRFYGADRLTKDVDLFAKNSSENASRLFAAISDVIGHPPAFPAEELKKVSKQVNFRKDGYQLEILTSIDGLDFDDAYSKRTLNTEKTIVIPVVSKEDLLSIKQYVARVDKSRQEKELRDIEFLKS